MPRPVSPIPTIPADAESSLIAAAAAAAIRSAAEGVPATMRVASGRIRGAAQEPTLSGHAARAMIAIASELVRAADTLEREIASARAEEAA